MCTSMGICVCTRCHARVCVRENVYKHGYLCMYTVSCSCVCEREYVQAWVCMYVHGVMLVCVSWL